MNLLNESPASAPDESLTNVRERVSDYYSAKVMRHGPTPSGVDWSCAPTQNLRFVQLLKLCDFTQPFSLNDLGCGYGAVLSYLAQRHRRCQIDYLGVDISAAMIEQARRRWRRKVNAKFIQGHQIGRQADCSIASGLFNVQLGHSDADWHRFVVATLQELHSASRAGFAVNFLLPAASGVVAIEGLYRTLPAPWVEHCQQAFAAEVTVLEAYGLREFTMLVRPRASGAAA